MSWRDAGKTAVVLGMDARVAFAFGLFFFHMSKVTFYLSLALAGVFIVGQMRRMTPVEMFRMFRFWLGGVHRPPPGRIGATGERLNAVILDSWIHPQEERPHA